MNWDIPLGRGRTLHLHFFGLDDRETDKEYEARVRKAQRMNHKPRRRGRMPDFRWNLSAGIQRDPARAPAGLEGKELAHWTESYHGTVAKGWLRLGWTRYRFKAVELEFAVGGEDGMVQWAFRSPLISWAFGFRVPSRWLEGWIYQRREWSISFGYLGSIALVKFAFDDSMRDMQSYYRRKFERGDDDRPVIRGRRFPTDFMIEHTGVSFYLGGTHVFRKQVVDRIFGKAVYERVKGDSIPVKVVMPEGQPDAGQAYDGTVSQTVSYWRRPRGWTKTVKGTEIELEHPPMFAGKGENSYDCEDDCYFSSSGPYETTEQAVKSYVESVCEQRRQHGNPSPKQTTPA